jgi:glycosyltransferase involved in cell wall biosynthesis
MAGAVPLQGSYEDKAGAPDQVFVDLDDATFARQVRNWTALVSEHTVTAPSVVHLHHLTPMHEAVRALWPAAPVITHLHGTELKMLRSVQDGTIPDHPGRYSREWVKRMRRWAGESDRLVVASAQDHQLALDLLPVDASRLETIANGVDTEVFFARPHPAAQRLTQWKRWLVDDPRGWCPGGGEGSIAYQADDLGAFTDAAGQPVPVVVFAGRFLRFKRVGLLIEAHCSMRSTTGHRSVLVIVGGFPGEWEGEHPYDTVRRLDAHDVFFAGWRDHNDLAEILSCGDVFAAPSVDETFGLVYLEAMAAGLPPIATTTGGPRRSSTLIRHNPPVGSSHLTMSRQLRRRSPRRYRTLSLAPLGAAEPPCSFASSTRGPRPQQCSPTSTKK